MTSITFDMVTRLAAPAPPPPHLVAQKFDIKIPGPCFSNTCRFHSLPCSSWKQMFPYNFFLDFVSILFEWGLAISEKNGMLRHI